MPADPRAVILAVARAWSDDPDGIADDLLAIADLDADTEVGRLLGRPGGTSARRLDAALTDLLERIAPPAMEVAA